MKSKSAKGSIRICSNGHRYVKSSDCPVCPICESNREPSADFMKVLGAPARRALEREGILTLEKLSKWSEEKLLALHGLGPASIPILIKELKVKGLTLKAIDPPRRIKAKSDKKK